MDHDVMYLQGQQQQQQQQQQLIQQHLLQQLLQRQQQPVQHQQLSQSLLVQTSQHQQQQLQHLQQQQQHRPIKRRTNQTPEEAQKGIKLCAVCSELAAGKYFGAEVCVPCKTFYLRYAHSGESFVCKGNDNCLITSTQRTCCKRCRFRKCKEAGMERKLRPMNVPLKEGQQKCVVCSDVANGIHFGALTCEGCKKFFRRGMNESHTYVCKANKNCTINPRTRNGCRYCRYQKCLSQKMSREAIQMGRPSKMNVPSIMSTPKKEKSPNPMASLGHPQQQQHSFQSQPHVLMGQSHSPQGGYYMNHQLNQMQPGASNDRHQGYLGEIPGMKLDQVASGFSKFVDEIEDHPSKMRYPCDQEGLPMVGYNQGQSSSLSQPLDYMIEDKQENKSFYSNGMNGGTAFSSAWHHGELNQASGMRPMRQPDNYCDTKIKIEQESAGLFYYLNHHPGGSNSNNGMQNSFETSLDWSEELTYRQADVIPDFAQSLHHASGSPSSMTDEIFSTNNNVGSADQHPPVEGSENHLGLFSFEENFAGNFDALQSLSAFPSHVPSSGNVIDLKSLLPPHHGHQSQQNFQDLFGSSGLSMSSQDIQDVLENANKMQSLPFMNLDTCSLESLMKNAESLVQEASSHAVDSKLKWNQQTLEEANRQFKPDGANEDLSEDDLSKAETNFHVEEGCFEDGSLYESLANVSRQYWLTLVLPKPDTHWMVEYNNACRNIIVPYKNFVSEMTILNQRLALEFNSWLNVSTKRPRDVSEFVEQNVVPEFTKLSVNYMKAIPGFVHLDPDDQKLLLRLAQSPSRILAASLNWYDQSNECFMPEFLPWRRLPEQQDPFFARLEHFARKIQKIRLDETEECFLNTVVIISADYPNLKNPDSVKETSMRFLKIFRAYTTLRSVRGSENTRLEFILSYVLELRHIGLLHHMSTTRPNMMAVVPSTSTHSLLVQPSSNLETLQNMLINGVDSRPSVSSTVKDRKSNGTGSSSSM